MNKEYKIEHAHDFLQVPEDRLDDCLSEFKHYLEDIKAFTDSGCEMSGIGGFTWIDDGEKKRDVIFKFMSEEDER